jgi:hypothetical protein
MYNQGLRICNTQTTQLHMENLVNLDNLYFVIRRNDMKVTCVTNKFFGGDPNYICEAATPQQISLACKQDPKLRIVRSN